MTAGLPFFLEASNRHAVSPKSCREPLSYLSSPLHATPLQPTFMQGSDGLFETNEGESTRKKNA